MSVSNELSKIIIKKKQKKNCFINLCALTHTLTCWTCAKVIPRLSLSLSLHSLKSWQQMLGKVNIFQGPNVLHETKLHFQQLKHVCQTGSHHTGWGGSSASLLWHERTSFLRSVAQKKKFQNKSIIMESVFLRVSNSYHFNFKMNSFQQKELVHSVKKKKLMC